MRLKAAEVYVLIKTVRLRLRLRFIMWLRRLIFKPSSSRAADGDCGCSALQKIKSICLCVTIDLANRWTDMVFLYNFIGPGKVYNIYPHFPKALNTATFSSFYFLYINQRKVTLYVQSILISHINKCPLKQGGKEH